MIKEPFLFTSNIFQPHLSALRKEPGQSHDWREGWFSGKPILNQRTGTGITHPTLNLGGEKAVEGELNYQQPITYVINNNPK